MPESRRAGASATLTNLSSHQAPAGSVCAAWCAVWDPAALADGSVFASVGVGAARVASTTFTCTDGVWVGELTCNAEDSLSYVFQTSPRARAGLHDRRSGAPALGTTSPRMLACLTATCICASHACLLPAACCLLMLSLRYRKQCAKWSQEFAFLAGGISRVSPPHTRPRARPLSHANASSFVRSGRPARLVWVVLLCTVPIAPASGKGVQPGRGTKLHSRMATTTVPCQSSTRWQAACNGRLPPRTAGCGGTWPHPNRWRRPS
jgi:hypothetical protein